MAVDTRLQESKRLEETLKDLSEFIHSTCARSARQITELKEMITATDRKSDALILQRELREQATPISAMRFRRISPVVDQYLLLDQFINIKQIDTVVDYDIRFREMASLIDGLPEDFLVSCYLRGLSNDVLRADVQLYGPSTLEMAMRLVHLQVANLESWRTQFQLSNALVGNFEVDIDESPLPMPIEGMGTVQSELTMKAPAITIITFDELITANQPSEEAIAMSTEITTGSVASPSHLCDLAIVVGSPMALLVLPPQLPVTEFGFLGELMTSSYSIEAQLTAQQEIAPVHSRTIDSFNGVVTMSVEQQTVKGIGKETMLNAMHQVDGVCGDLIPTVFFLRTSAFVLELIFLQGITRLEFVVSACICQHWDPGGLSLSSHARQVLAPKPTKHGSLFPLHLVMKIYAGQFIEFQLSCLTYLKMYGETTEVLTPRNFDGLMNEIGEGSGAIIIRHGLSSNSRVTTQLISSCSLHKSINYALLIFGQFNCPNLYVFNALIRALADNSHFESSISYFVLMLMMNVQPNRLTLPYVLKSVAALVDGQLGTEVHGLILQTGHDLGSFIRVCLVDFYVQVELLGAALQLFDESPARNKLESILLWNVLINGCCEAGELRKAAYLFETMPERNAGSWNILIYGFMRTGQLDRAKELFDRMPEKNVVSWTTMVSGFSRNGHHTKAVSIYFEMLEEVLKPNDVTVVFALSACAKVGALEAGVRIHNYLSSNGFPINKAIGSFLVDMYAKCGSIESAGQVFGMTTEKDLCTWSVMIWGWAIHGCFQQALQYFEMMKSTGVYPDGAVVLAILSACSHSGQVDKGLSFFDSMRLDYSIEPTMKHSALIVDLLGRASRLDEALCFLNSMPVDPDFVIWGALFCSSRAHKNIAMAIYADRLSREMRELFQLKIMRKFAGAIGLDIAGKLLLVQWSHTPRIQCKYWSSSLIQRLKMQPWNACIRSNGDFQVLVLRTRPISEVGNVTVRERRATRQHQRGQDHRAFDNSNSNKAVGTVSHTTSFRTSHRSRHSSSTSFQSSPSFTLNTTQQWATSFQSSSTFTLFTTQQWEGYLTENTIHVKGVWN